MNQKYKTANAKNVLLKKKFGTISKAIESVTESQDSFS